MSENQHLLARISQLAGNINIHRGKLEGTVIADPSDLLQSNGAVVDLPHLRGHGSRAPSRYSGRGGRQRLYPRSSHPYRNRSLVVKQSSSRAETMDTDQADQQDGMLEEEARHTTNWIKKLDRHAQLINSSVYDKQATQRAKAIEQTRQEQSSRKDQQERKQIGQHLKKMASKTHPAVATDSPSYRISIEGSQFQVCNGGSKLLRIQSHFPHHHQLKADQCRCF